MTVNTRVLLLKILAFLLLIGPGLMMILGTKGPFMPMIAGSVLAGAWFNAVINVAILGAFLLPLLAGSRQS